MPGALRFLLPLLLLANAPAEVDHPQTYLLSIDKLGLTGTDQLNSFSFDTWGVTVNAVCHIPEGWTITAGGSLTPDGVIKGEGSLGTSWLMETSGGELQNLLLITMYAPVQQDDIKWPGGEIPATFKGTATIGAGDDTREEVLSAKNITLVPASACKAPTTKDSQGGVTGSP
ncbi:hypothetical protein [Novosphingobium sp. 9]|uniref:hypothetical protein n=1 Tax=Novosphingobium sp. 9 TaxID=2025349 RepID=UPI0021B51E44|nr:hypothetical protein [Novosphingobium sp. 9]